MELNIDRISSRTASFAVVTATGLLILSACSSSSDSSGTEPMMNETDNTVLTDVLTGVFTDGVVQGIDYKTDTLNGKTNAMGEFEYRAGEKVIFSIGSLNFPELAAAPVLSTLDMSPTADFNDNVVINTSVLLQSLDTDGNHDNGISISDTAGASATTIDFTVAPDQFASNVDVINLIANAGSTNSGAIDANTAINNLQQTLDGVSADAVAITTVSDYLDAGATALSGAEITAAFSGRTFISLDGKWDWTFTADGQSYSFSRVGNLVDDFPNIPWYVDGDNMCRRETPRCTRVYQLGNTYRWGVEGDNEALTPWAVKAVGSAPAGRTAADLAARLSTGADGSQAFPRWNCTFVWLDDSGNENAANTITFGDNGVGRVTSGSSYTWSAVNGDYVLGSYTDIDRKLELYDFNFSSDDAFTAINISTVDVGTESETARPFAANCVRQLSE